METRGSTSVRDAPLRVLLDTGRPAIRSYLDSLAAHLPGLAVEPFRRDEPRDASVVVLDVALDPRAGVESCREVRERLPSVPIAVLLCCPQALDPWQLQSLFAAGAGSVLDLQARPEETARLLESAARGSTVIHLHLRRSHRTLLRDLFVDRGPRGGTRLRLLELVARGLSDQEIGRELHLSPHTVKHHIDALRTDLGVRNRTELAAWAGRHGFYADDPRETAPVPVDLARPGRR